MAEEPTRPAEPWHPTGPQPDASSEPAGIPAAGPNMYGYGTYGSAPIQPVKKIRRNPLAGCGTMVLIVVVIAAVVAAAAFAFKPSDDEKQDAAPKKRALTNTFGVVTTTTIPPEDRSASLTKACSQGLPADKAPAYAAGDPAAFGAIVGAGSTYKAEPFPLVAGTKATGDAMQQVELLGCITAYPNGYYEQCEYSTTQGRVTMQRISGTDVELRVIEAKTGKLVGTEKFTVSQDTSCPGSIDLLEGEPTPTWDMPWGEVRARAQAVLTTHHQG